MTKTILILASLFAVACGGDVFTSGAEFNALGGDAGAPDATAGTGSVAGTASAAGSTSHGGSQGAGGSSSSQAGKPSGGSAAGGVATGGSSGAPATCDLNIAKLTAALPTELVWQDYTYTSGDLCVTCRDKPCGAVHVISWGVPQTLEDGRLDYQPNVDQTTISMNFGTNDGMCTKKTECGVQAGVASVLITVAKSVQGWEIAEAQVQAGVSENACTQTAGGLGATGPMGADLGTKLATALKILKISCS
jgi:hypothetical protein